MLQRFKWNDFINKLKKWIEMPYIQDFMALKDKSNLFYSCKIDPCILALLIFSAKYSVLGDSLEDILSFS